MLTVTAGRVALGRLQAEGLSPKTILTVTAGRVALGYRLKASLPNHSYSDS